MHGPTDADRLSWRVLDTPKWVIVVTLLGLAMTLSGLLVGGDGLEPVELVMVFGLLPGAILALLVVSGGRRPVPLFAASILIDVEALFIAAAWTVGPAYAILLPMIGLALALGALHDRTLRAAFVLAGLTSFVAVVVALVVGPIGANIDPLGLTTTIVASGLLIAFADAYLWRLHDNLTSAVARAEAEMTARTAAEGELTQLATAVGQAADVVFISDRDRRIVYANPAFERVTGYPVEEALGRGIKELVRSGVHDAAYYAELRDVTAAGRSWSGTITNRRKDGSTFDFEVSLSPIRDDTGAFVGTVTVGRDRSEAQAMERALRESEARFRTVVELAPEAVGMSRNGLTLYGNRRYREVFGLRPDEDITGRPIIELWAPESRPLIADYIRRRGQGKDAPSSYEATGQRMDGSRFPVHASVTTVQLSDGPASIAFLSDLTEVKQAHADLDLQARVRGALTEVQHWMPAGADAVVAADRVCEALSTLPGVDFAAVFGFVGRDEVRLLAHRGPEGFPAQLSNNRSQRAREMHRRAGSGPYAEAWQPSSSDGPWSQAVTGMGIKATAFGPVVHGDHVDGIVALATTDEAFARTMIERLPAVVDFSTTPSALLAERIHAWREAIETHARLRRLIARSAFEPVFQPIVDLGSRSVVAYEALTRFGRLSAEQVFVDAWRVGLGPELELATLARAVKEAEKLPSGRWLNVNVSPELLHEASRLREALARAERPIVLEITEQQLVDDYPGFRARLAELGTGIRLAVDDAGAGAANFNHIVELRPDFVKLDMRLVREVNVNLGRQALVIAMNHFGRTTGCRLVAEGIETEEEAETLQSLGVEYGQGYLLGRPASASDIVGDQGRPARQKIVRIA